ncbi:MAG: IPT/TIG domain-containing protein [Bryobacteraceae bacterium]
MPETTPQPALSIVPATADVNAKSVCHFRVEPAGTEVSWEIRPSIGVIDRGGVYSSPEEVSMPQSVVVIATSKSGLRATAAIDLTDAPKRIRWLAWYAIGMAALLGTGILIAWSHLYRPANPVQVIVNPPLVTLDPGKDEKFVFTATVLGDSRNAVTWAVEGGGEIDSTGTFRQKTDGAAGISKAIKITARSVAEPALSGTAAIQLVSGKHLEVTPQAAAVFASQQVPFRTPNAAAKWSVSRSDIASISPDGMFTAGLPRETTAVVQVTAWGSTANERAGAAVILTGSGETTDFGNWPLMVFVIMCGALGSMVYYVSSFVGYVGNRTFRSSWFWFYISRPFVGGALAIIFFFIVGSGMINGATVTELMKVGMVSALVGLFSDKAVKKLSDIVDVLLTTKDDRKDKVTDVKKESVTGGKAAPAGSAAPTILSATPSAIPPDTATKVEFKGTNFKAGLKVKINGQDVTPTKQNEGSFELAITAEQAQPPKVAVTATTDAGTAAFDLDVN